MWDSMSAIVTGYLMDQEKERSSVATWVKPKAGLSGHLLGVLSVDLSGGLWVDSLADLLEGLSVDALVGWSVDSSEDLLDSVSAEALGFALEQALVDLGCS